MWKHLTHPNVLLLLGVTIDGFQLISNWISGGHLPGYIKKNSDADRLGLVRVLSLCLFRAYSRCQLSDVAKGLYYLHSCNVIHGDLKGVRGRSKSRSSAALIPR
jgi:serine/threonine protein kinase